MKILATLEATKMVALYGKKLIGKIVITEEIGSWPGGLAIVCGLIAKDDPNLVMFVKIPGLREFSPRFGYGDTFGRMGIFGGEEVQLTNLKKLPDQKIDPRFNRKKGDGK